MNSKSYNIASNKTLYRLAGISALLALAANVLDILLSFGETEVIVSGTMSATEWFSLFEANGFKGLYMLGILNIVYLVCLIPVYLAMLVAHRQTQLIAAAIATLLFLLALAIYVSNNAAIPMAVLSDKYAAASTETQQELLAAAGEAVLARGEDFTPGSFPGLILSGIAAIMISFVMLRGGFFGKINAWMGIIGFTFLLLFTVVATFVRSLFFVAFFGLGMTGGLLALTWFLLTGLKFFKLNQTNIGL